jgi:hypothetical protein
LAAAAPVVTSSNALRIPAAVDIAVAAPVPTVGSGIGSFVSVPSATITVAAVAPTTTTNGVDGDAAAYIAAVESADGQSLEEGVKSAINSFVLGCKADGIWTAIKASCILAGARTLTGALVPLVGTAPTNVGGLFVSGDYDRETGLVGNGSTKSLNSNYAIPVGNQNNAHAACRASSISGGAKLLFADAAGGSGNTATNISVKFDTSEVFSRLSQLNQNTTSESPGAGLYGVSRSASGSYTLRSNGSSKSITETSATPPAINVSLFTRTSSPAFYFDGRLAFYSIGESLDLALLDTRVTALIDAIAAAIP